MSVRDAPMSDMASSIPRLVLDTNVCLDLFVFGDARCAGLQRALQTGEVTAVTDEACREEWRRVLTYPVLKLDEGLRIAAQARFDALVRDLPMTSDVLAEQPQAPRCRDPHDQKFLDLAVRANARWLLSRDDHLLSLARRARRDGLFEILTPETWLAARAASVSR